MSRYVCLNPSEHNYAQVEKKALSLNFGLHKCHQFIYGRTFTLVTDHKPFATILGPKQTIPSLAAAQLQRWALLLAGYSCNIKFKPTSVRIHQPADALSRLPGKDSNCCGELARCF